jgi:hypothetical protein
MRAILLIVSGCAALILGLFLVLPVAVNLPDSWFGVVLIILLLVGSGLLLYKGVRIGWHLALKEKQRKASAVENKQD